MVLEATPRSVSMAAADIHKAVSKIEAKIRAVYKDADFDLLVGPDDAYHLRVFTSEPSLWKPIELVEDDLFDLQEAEQIQLYVIPLRHEDREGVNDPPGFMRNGQ